MELDYEHFGQRLVIARELAGLSQDALAIKTGISRKTIGNYEKGEKPQTGQPQKLAEACEVDVVWLLTGEGMPRAPLFPKASVLSDQKDLYAKTEYKEKDGEYFRIERFESEENIASLNRLVSMISRRDDEVNSLKARNETLEATLNQVLKILSNHARPSEQERRSMMSEIFQVFDGNEFLKRR